MAICHSSPRTSFTFWKYLERSLKGPYVGGGSLCSAALGKGLDGEGHNIMDEFILW